MSKLVPLQWHCVFPQQEKWQRGFQCFSPSSWAAIADGFNSNHTFCFWETSILLALVYDKAQLLQGIPLKSKGRAWPVQQVPEYHSLRYEFAILMKTTWGQVFKGLKSPAFKTDSSLSCRVSSVTKGLSKHSTYCKTTGLKYGVIFSVIAFSHRIFA